MHFEIHDPSGNPFSPFNSLQAATKITTPTPEPKQPYEILPYENFKGGASVAAGRFGANGVFVTGAGPGGGPLVKVLSVDGNVQAQFFAYPQAFKGGVDVAAGDIDGDGIDEIITGAGAGGGPQVRILRADGVPLKSFFAYPLAFRGGVRVAAGDIDGDGKAEIITGAGPDGGPQVRIFKSDGTAIKSFFAYATTFRGGLDVALKPYSSVSHARIITSAGAGGGPQVRIFDANGAVENSFFAYPETFRGGVKIAVTNVLDVNNYYEIVAVPASKGGPDIRLFSPIGTLVSSRKAFEPWWRGGYEVDATVNGTIYITANGRRASIRTVSGSSYYNNNNNNNNGGFGNNRPRRWWGN